jgi:hypothetical protein
MKSLENETSDAENDSGASDAAPRQAENIR